MSAVAEIFSLERVLSAYETTGLEPTRGEWTDYWFPYDEDDEAAGMDPPEPPFCACPASAVACSSGVKLEAICEEENEEGGDPARLIAEHLGLSYEAVVAFARGFDGESFVEILNKIENFRKAPVGEAARLVAEAAWQHGRTIRKELALRDLVDPLESGLEQIP